jgi:hypothetical protein
MVSSATVFFSMLVPGLVVAAPAVPAAANSAPAAMSTAQEQRVKLTAMTLPLSGFIIRQV